MPKTTSRPIYVFSDSTGETASRAVSVALEQFQGIDTVEHRIPDVRTPAKIAQIMHAAAETRAIVVYTLVNEELRMTARTAAEGLGVIAVDLFEHLVPALSKWIGKEPLHRPGHPFDNAYFARIRAIDFAALHDDGKNHHELKDAEIVLLGLSRTQKTPACWMLAEHRILAANVPIVPNVELPAELDAIDPQRIFVLKMGIDRLTEVRSSRITRLGISAAGAAYVDREAIRDEVLYATRLLTRHPEWTAIDVTRSSVEETAARVMSMYRERFPAE